MTWMGMDGCRGGWIYVMLGREWDAGIVDSLERVYDKMACSSLIFIDMPIGFPDQLNPIRACDKLARKILGKRRSSIFPVPARQTLKAENYEEANIINRKFLGRGLSKQSWNLAPRLLELDRFLQNEGTGLNIREAHPEVLFWNFNQKEVIETNKKTEEGFFSRFNILLNYFPEALELKEYILGKHNRKEVSRDDVLDAMVLAVAARETRRGIVSLPGMKDFDQKGFRREIVFPLLSPETKKGK